MIGFQRRQVTYHGWVEVLALPDCELLNPVLAVCELELDALTGTAEVDRVVTPTTVVPAPLVLAPWFAQ